MPSSGAPPAAAGLVEHSKSLHTVPQSDSFVLNLSPLICILCMAEEYWHSPGRVPPRMPANAGGNGRAHVVAGLTG